RREQACAANHEAAWAAVCALGGTQGYYAADWLWRLRGGLDRIAGGPGLRRGRRSARELRLGDALDFWRVTAIDPPRRLELRAEMKAPGAAMLTLEVEPAASSEPGPRSAIVMTA